MSNTTYLLALDQGTSSCRSVVFSPEGDVVAMAQKELRQIFPQPGWVEHEPQEIWSSQLATARQVLQQAGLSADQIASMGITNQRETTVVWRRDTGQPIYNAIVWQDRRAEPECLRLREAGFAPMVQQKTGLLIDAYFSATKLQWILDNVKDARAMAEAGQLAFGTVDSWLMWQLSGGRIHATDVSNAARTMLLNVLTNHWDDELLALFRIPASVLPEVHPSASDFGYTQAQWLGSEVPIGGVAGDQQSALFGQACFQAGQAKNTYGTGCFMLMHTGSEFQTSHNGLITTSAAQADGTPAFALEGSVFIGGAVVQWLRDGLRAFDKSADVQALAESVPDSGGVVLVPAFTGLGAPYWQADARGGYGGFVARHHHGTYRSSSTGEHRFSKHSFAASHEPRCDASGDRVAGGWRRLRQRFADAVPGRFAGHSCAAPASGGNHRLRCGLFGGVERGHLPQHDRVVSPVAGRALF